MIKLLTKGGEIFAGAKQIFLTALWLIVIRFFVFLQCIIKNNSKTLVDMKKCIFILLALLGLTQQLSADLIEGQCGDGVIYQWHTETGKLVISGHGPMYDTILSMKDLGMVPVPVFSNL